jgi:hypothetical protein
VVDDPADLETVPLFLDELSGGVAVFGDVLLKWW